MFGSLINFGRKLFGGESSSSPGGGYTEGPDAQGYGGPGQIAGGGKVKLNALNLPYFQQDRDRLMGLLGGRSPFAGDEWGALIGQLQQRASGQGPSLAEMDYRRAAQDTVAALGSLSRGSATPGAARAAMIQQGRIGQGMAAGLAQARTAEQMAAQQALTGALGARDQLNQNAYLNVLAQQLGLSMGQLNALQGNQQYALGMANIDQQRQAAKWNAIAGMLGMGATLAGGK